MKVVIYDDQDGLVKTMHHKGDAAKVWIQMKGGNFHTYDLIQRVESREPLNVKTRAAAKGIEYIDPLLEAFDAEPER